MVDLEVGKELRKVFEYHTFQKKSLSQYEVKFEIYLYLNEDGGVLKRE
jgi:hypothetical protein